MTDAFGRYMLRPQVAGFCTVREVAPAGWAQSSPLPTGQQAIILRGDSSPGPWFENVLISSATMNMSYFMLITRNFGEPGTFATGDLNGDGTVNLADLLLLTRNFGHALPTSAVASATPAAPAPAPAMAARRR